MDGLKKRSTPLRSNDIRRRNEKLVLSLIYHSREISQSEIVQRTGLKPPTVFRIFTGLESEGLIRAMQHEYGQAERKGRRPVYYAVIPEARYAVGIDFWGRSASSVVVDFSGRAILSRTVDFPPNPVLEQVLQQLEQLIREALDLAALPPDKLLGIGLGAPGRVDIGGGRLVYYSRIQGMRDFPIAAWLQERFHLPVKIHNNASVIGLSEHRYGQAAAARSLLVLVIRSGVGGAFIQDGTVFVNHNRTTMELGHMAIVEDGRPCDCGENGCLETYLSEDALVADLAARMPVASLADLDRLLERNDAAALEFLGERASLLATAARNLIHLLGPDVILVVTRSHRLGEFFKASLQRSLHEQHNVSVLSDLPEVLAADYDPVRACHGAADLVFDQFFN
jgi:predicted NBD/HSP70 family sugar kinase